MPPSFPFFKVHSGYFVDNSLKGEGWRGKGKCRGSSYETVAIIHVGVDGLDLGVTVELMRSDQIPGTW